MIGNTFGFNYDTACDGESNIHLYVKGGIEFAAKHLDGVFLFCLIDTASRKVYLGRDTFGIKPGFRVTTEKGVLATCSEAKSGLINLSFTQHYECITSKVEPFPPGHVETYALDIQGRAVLTEKARFHKIGESPAYPTFSVEIGSNVKENIRELLTMAARKRLMAERRIGCLLSGGLDSSLVTALVAKLAKELCIAYKIRTFSTGMEDSTDLQAAKKVAKYLDTEHHEIVFTAEQGMYLMCQYIKEKTDCTVLISGEGSDEVTEGYIYFHKAPSAEDASEESKRLCNDLYMYDALRVDRTSAAWGLEVRVPFLDHRFSSYYLSLPDEERFPKHGIEKHLLRSSFAGQGLIPDEILWRPKEEFSDGLSSVTKSWYEILQTHIDGQINDKEVQEASEVFTHNPPKSKEALYYRKIFERSYPKMGEWIPYYWMNRWTETSDPSARTLKHYKQ